MVLPNKDNKDICFKRQLGKITKTTGNDKWASLCYSNYFCIETNEEPSPSNAIFYVDYTTTYSYSTCAIGLYAETKKNLEGRVGK